jgi:endonuclease/exonuclease/phosphatase family metal-dependent hydrolase
LLLLFPLQWNIERGYQLAGIIEELRSIDADVISLQEVDVGCERSGGADTGAPMHQCNSAAAGAAAVTASPAPLHQPLQTPIPCWGFCRGGHR